MGAAVAARLAGGTRRLIVADVNVSAAQRIANDLPGSVEAVRCDLSVDGDIDAVVEAASEVGSLVITAGLSPTMAAGRRIFEVNLRGMAYAVQAFEAIAGAGSVGVIFASSAAHMAPVVPALDAVLDDPFSPTFFEDLARAGIDVDEPGGAYSFAKRGVVRLAARSAGAWGAKGARLVSLSPGIVETPMGRLELENQPMMQAMIDATAIGRMLTADEVAAAAAFLLSDAASGITGTDLLVDGGGVAGVAQMMAALG